VENKTVNGRACKMMRPDLLARLYGWFTEGHNTRDLKEA
jgi:hypothetical protein